MAFQFMPGATAVGISYTNGVVLAARKARFFWEFCGKQKYKENLPCDGESGRTCAGMIADMQVLVRQVTALAKIRRLETRREVPPNSIAKLMSVIMFERRFFPLLTQVIVGGIDQKPQIYTLDPLGSVLPDEYATVGTGAEMALGIMDAEYKPNMTEEKARDLAIRAISHRYKRDSSSGDGIDILMLTDNQPREQSLPI